MPHVETPISESLDARLAIFRAILDLIAPAPGTAAVDLGCGHCLFMRTAEDFGLSVTGIDARTERVPPDVMRRGRFLQMRVQDADLSCYGLILCLGILYHLMLEDQLSLIGKFRGRCAIVDTHYGAEEKVNLTCDGERYAGVIFREGNGLKSSVGNRESFWPIEPDLVRMLGAHHDVLKWMPEHHPGRSFYVMLPRQGACR